MDSSLILKDHKEPPVPSSRRNLANFSRNVRKQPQQQQQPEVQTPANRHQSNVSAWSVEHEEAPAAGTLPKPCVDESVVVLTSREATLLLQKSTEKLLKSIDKSEELESPKLRKGFVTSSPLQCGADELPSNQQQVHLREKLNSPPQSSPTTIVAVKKPPQS